MHTNIHPALPVRRRPARPAAETFRQPRYDCQEQREAIKLVLYVPGVDASGVEIEGRGADLTVTACKQHFVRVNWQPLHLEGAQRDYRLRLRLGSGFDYAAMQAQISDGVLTINLPKKVVDPSGLRQVA